MLKKPFGRNLEYDLKKIFFYLILAVLGLQVGLRFVVVHWLLIVVPSLAVEHGSRMCGLQ